jgi:aerobic carbon-monoxide dehydrogenase medium subunit
MLRPFALHRPATVAEASEILAQQGRDAALYAGGTEVLLILKEGLLRVKSLVDVKRLPGLADIRADNGHLLIGATATHRTVEHAPEVLARCPLIARVARHVANVRVRSVGTVGGNLAFADPHSDLATAFLLFDATVRLAARAGERELALGDFVVGPYETARRDEEILTSVRLAPWPAGTAGAYVKYGLHERPTLGVAVALTVAGGAVRGARIAVGCVGPRPQRLAGAEARLGGWSLADVERRAEEVGAEAAVAVDAVDDLHGSAEYKRDMTRVFVRRALLVAAARAAGRESHERHPHTVVV